MKTFAGAYVNLLKTSIGSGVLSFPYLFKTYGIAMTILLTVVSGFFATTGLILLTECSQVLGREADLSKLASLTFPYARIFVDFAVFSKCFGVSLSYVIISKQLLPSVIEAFVHRKSFFSSPPVCSFIFLAFVGPLAYFTKLDKLKYTSFIGVSSILLVIAAAVFRYTETSETSTDIIYFAPISLGWLTGLGKFIFSFTCHQNIFAVNAELEDNSVGRMKKLILTVSLSSFSLYISFGLTNYLLYGNDVTDNVLNNYPQDLLATIVRGLYVIVMGVSYPLQLAPARCYFMNIIGISTKTKKYMVIHFLITTILISLTYLIALSGAELGIVYSIVGATASCFMCLILPALFYFNLDIERTLWLTVTGYFAFLFGIVVFATTIFALVISNSHHV